MKIQMIQKLLFLIIKLSFNQRNQNKNKKDEIQEINNEK